MKKSTSPKTATKTATAKTAAPKAKKEKSLAIIAAPKEKKAKAEAKVETPSKKAIEILDAKYGISGNMINVENVKIGRKASNLMAGSDPAPKEAKVMIITANVAGETITKTFNEGEKVTF